MTVVPWVMPGSQALPPSTADSGTAVWRHNGAAAPRYREWDGSAFAPVQSSAGTGEWRIMQGAAAPTRSEVVAAGVRSDGNITGEIWNGGSWAALPFNPLATVTETYWWSVDVAYEVVSGDALLVWANGSAGTTPLSFRAWDGSSWTAAAPITVPLPGRTRQLLLVAAPDSDEMVLVASNEFSQDYAVVWDGSAWGNALTLDASGNNDDRTDIAAAYLQQSGTALVAYGRNSANPHFRNWDGSGWSGEFTINAPAGISGKARWLALASDPGSDALALGVLTFANEVWLGVWDGSAWIDLLEATGAAAGQIFPGVAVAFEDASGEALATYAEANNRFRFRTWAAGSGWSARRDGADLGAHPNSMTLDARSDSNEIMLAVQDDASDLHYTLWDGSAWGAQTEVDTDTGEIKNQPFLFLWDHPGNRPPRFDQEAGDRSDSEGSAVSFTAAATDPDGQALTYSATGLPPGIVIDPSDGTISGVVAYPSALWSPYSVELTVSDGVLSDTAAFTWSVAASEGLLLATRDAVTGSGIPGLPAWGRAEVLSFGNPGLAWSPPLTTGTFGTVLDFEAFGSADLNGLEFVTRDITIGGSIALQAGDILFSLAADATLTSDNQLTVRKADVVRFRPAGGDLSHGTFEVVLDNSLAADLWGLALVEVDTVVAADATLPAGSFVLIRSGGAEDNDLWLFEPTSAGEGSTSGTTSLLVEGDDLGMNEKVWGVDLIEEFGGGTSQGTATLVFRGSDVGLDTDKERPNAIAFRSANRPPAFSQDLGARTDAEGDAITLPAPATDPDGDTLAYSATGLPPGIAVDPATGLVHGSLTYSAAAGSPYAVTLRVEDPGGLFDTDSFTWTVTDTVVGLGIIKASDAEGVAAPGQEIGYTITLEVPGVSHQTGIAVTDPLPAGTTYVPGSTVVEAPAVVRDEFDPIAYDGEDGALLWSGPWVEIDGGPVNAGPDQVVADATWRPDSPCFRMGGYGEAMVDEGIDRTVDLSGRTSAVLHFDRRRRLLGSAGGTAYIQMRQGLDPWTTVASWALNTTDPAPVHEAYDVSSFIGASTSLRITISGTVYSYIYIDGVAIVADGVVAEAGGAPPNLASGYHLEPGEALTVRFFVTVNDPPGVTEVQNTATVTSDQEPGGRSDTTWDDIALPPAFDQDLPDRTDAEGAVISLPSPATDPDGDPLDYTATGLPPGLSIAPATGLISGRISYDAAAASPYSVVVRVEDPAGLFDTDAFTWTVTDTNRPPVVTNPGDQAGAEGDPVDLAVDGSDPDWDTLAWQASSLPPGLSIDPTTGVISGTISYDAAAGSPYSVEVRVEDPGGLFDIAAFLWVVAPTNRPPGFDGDLGDRTDAEGDAISVAAPATDLDGDTLTWSVTGLPPGLDTDPATGLISGTVSYDASPGSPYSVEVRVEDPGGLFDTDTFTWFITHTNRAPGFDGDLGDRSDAEGAVISVAAPATDLDGDALTWSATGLPSGLGIDPASGLISGTLTYDASPGSPYPVEVRVEDPGGLFDTDTFTWTVTDTNRAPVLADPGDQAGAEGDVISLASAAGDPDGDALLWSATGLPPGLGIDPASGLISGTITYDASSGSPYAVTVRVEDAGGLFDTASLTWTVSDTNRAPTFDGDLVDRAEAEGAAVLLLAPATDLDGDTLTWSATGLPPGLSIDPATGDIAGDMSFDASPGSPYAVAIRVEDPGGLFDTDTFTWTITDTNRAPTLAGGLGNRSDAEGAAVSVPAPATDPDGDTLTWSATGLPPGLSIDPTTGEITGTVTYDAAPASPYAVTVRVTDDRVPALWGEAVFTWTVSDTNRAPAVTDPGDQSSAEGDVVSLAPAGSDPDGDGLTWSAAGLPDGLSIDPATGVVSGTIGFEAAPASPYGVTVTATDDGVPSLASGVSFLWWVASTNRAPQVLHPGDRWDAEGDEALVAVVGSDPDGDPLTWSAAGLPPGLSIDPATGEISGILTFEAGGSSPYAVTVTATDDGSPALADTTTFSWTVANTNRPPVLTDPGPQASAEGDTVVLTLEGGDPDGDGLAWSAAGLPPGLSIDPATGRITGTITYEAAAGSPHTVAVAAEDDGLPALTSGFSFTWTVAGTNRAPLILSPGDQVSAEGTPVAVGVAGSDPDGDGLAWSAAGLPPGLAIDPGSGDISGDLGFDAAGVYPVTLTATDDGTPAMAASTTFTWEVANTNRPPVLTDPGPQASAEGDTVVLVLEGGNPDGDDLTWSATGLPAGLVIDPATATISGTPGFDVAGFYPVTVAAADAGSPPLEAAAAFTWTVTDVNRAPVVVVPADRTDPEGAAVALAIVGSDPDGDGLAWSAAGLPPGLTIDPATGTIAGTIDFGAAAGAPYRVTVAATDDGAPRAAAGGTFTWSIGDVDRPPVLGALPDRFGQVGDVVAAALAASDPDGDTIAWSASGLPGGVSLDPATGQLNGTLAGAGAFTVTVTVTASGLEDTGSFTWVVSAPGVPVIEPIPNQSGQIGDAVTLAVEASDPQGDTLAFSATGLPPGLAIGRDTGLISGILEAAAAFPVTVTASGSGGVSASASFLWAVEEPIDLPPEVQDDFVIVARDDLGEDGVVVVEVLGNDFDPEGEPLVLVGVSAPEVGEATTVDATVVFRPPAAWIGTVTMTYRAADPSGQESEGLLTITVQAGTEVLLPASTLHWNPPAGSGVGIPSLGTSGTLVGALVQSLRVLRVPLALLGGAVIWSLLLGGVVNVGLAVRRGLPAVLSRRGRLMAIVLAPQGAKVPALSKPGLGEEVVHQYLATDSRIKATGRRAQAAGREWLEVITDKGPGWVEAMHLAEHLDRGTFVGDRAAWQLIEDWVEALRRRLPAAGLASRYGLWVAYHGDLVHYPPDRVAGLCEDPEVRVWKGRNPAYPDLHGTFDDAVGAGVLDAYDHPRMELAPDQTAVPSTVIPVEFTNLHFISIGADLIGPERLDQTAWLVHIAYEDGKPRVIGLCREG